VVAGLDVITHEEQTRLDFDLSYYGYIHGIEYIDKESRKFGPPAHDQSDKNHIAATLSAYKCTGIAKEHFRLKNLFLKAQK
jgi:5-methyltetrahydropteroyltriglutamate--homocysteine methyltransferase